MRSALVFAIAGLAAAAPRPQGLDFQEIDVGVQVAECNTFGADKMVQAAGTPTIVTPPNDVATDAVKYDTKAAQASASAAVVADPATPATRRSLQRRDDCAKQPDGYGPTSTPDTADNFLQDPQYDVCDTPFS